MFKKKDSAKNPKDAVPTNDGRLIIDCKGCKGQSSVTDRECIVCICRRAMDRSKISSILMRSSADLSMDDDAVQSIRELAFVHRLMTMNRSERRGNRCRRCRKSFSAIVKDQLGSFPDVNIQLLRDRMSQIQFTNPICTLCASDTLGLINTLESTLDGIGLADRYTDEEVE